MKEDAKKLCRLLGSCVIQAPSEAEAQCSELVKLNLAYATWTTDVDCLTFGSKYFLRNFDGKDESLEIISLP